ncbi:MAG: exodeoxyribonuclease VII large subunit [Dehalococcoidia bacterium]|nr:exodeoxyribonuclease VII large subunit [Dehalococcoidia bacterium]
MPTEVRPVWQVVRYLRELLAHDPVLADLWVGGEVTNLTTAASGHMYFTLKDAGGQLRCVFFRSANIGQRGLVANGASLIAHGAITIYEMRGDVQLLVDFVQPAGVGAQQAEFERRKARFEAEGLFDPARKRALPRFPRRIGVVTSAQGAAIHDIQTVLARRWPLATIVFRPATVQGDEAANSVAEAVRDIAPLYAASERWPDVLIVGRGGGANDDLSAFNEEPVVRAIFGCPIPVVSAVGHETDVTLADFVADVRAATPSAAAELVAPDRLDIVRQVDALRARQEVRVTRAVAAAREATDGTTQRMARRLPDVAPLHRGVALHAEALRHHVLRTTAEARERIAGTVSRLHALSPSATLERGYALVSNADGAPISRASDVTPGDAIEVRWSDGSHGARVESRS